MKKLSFLFVFLTLFLCSSGDVYAQGRFRIIREIIKIAKEIGSGTKTVSKTEKVAKLSRETEELTHATMPDYQNGVEYYPVLNSTELGYRPYYSSSKFSTLPSYTFLHYLSGYNQNDSHNRFLKLIESDSFIESYYEQTKGSKYKRKKTKEDDYDDEDYEDDDDDDSQDTIIAIVEKIGETVEITDSCFNRVQFYAPSYDNQMEDWYYPMFYSPKFTFVPQYPSRLWFVPQR